MSADGSSPAVRAGAVRVMPAGRPFSKGFDPRRGIGNVTAAERAFREALDGEHIPKASALLKTMYDAGMAGDVKAAELFFKVCGLIRKPVDDAAIQEVASRLLEGMIGEVRARRAAETQQAQPAPEGKMIDVGSDETD